MIDAIIAANPGQVETYRGGKEGVLGFFVGAVMRETQGKADPKVVNRLLLEKLQRRRQVAHRRAERPERAAATTTGAASTSTVMRGDVCVSSSPAASGPSGPAATAACSRPTSRGRAAGRG